MIKAYFDGICEPNKPNGRAGLGVVIKKDDKTIYTKSEFIGQSGMSNSVAEYSALFHVLQYLKSNNFNKEPIIVHGDSEFIIKQMLGEYKIKKGLYKKNALETMELAREFNNITYKWIPRSENAEADKLSIEAIKGR